MAPSGKRPTVHIARSVIFPQPLAWRGARPLSFDRRLFCRSNFSVALQALYGSDADLAERAAHRHRRSSGVLALKSGAAFALFLQPVGFDIGNRSRSTGATLRIGIDGRGLSTRSTRIGFRQRSAAACRPWLLSLRLGCRHVLPCCRRFLSGWLLGARMVGAYLVALAAISANRLDHPNNLFR